MRSIKIYSILFLLTLAVFTSTSVSAQETETTTESVTEQQPETLTQQYQTLKQKANTWKKWKLIKPEDLDALWGQVQDSLGAERNEIIESNKKLTESRSEVESLNKELETKKNELAQSDYINVLGIDMLKPSYVTFNMIVILVLIILLAVAVLKFKSSNKLASEKRKEAEKIEEELKSIRKRAQEKEIQLRRELVTERNKVEELQQKVISMKKDRL
ncbi:hypothetical protein V6R21_14275 [Limibacter armeniacum]|uniref:hypothetical protein n=1 Tax=Limibacter armeniacum TaxID=466084 RepID=UPI002FE6AB92